MDYEFIKGDGSCMFRSLVQAEHNATQGGTALGKRQEALLARALRKRVVDYIKEHRNVYYKEWQMFINDHPDLNTYAKRMMKTTTFGDNLEMQIASVILRRVICVVPQGGMSYMLKPRVAVLKSQPLYLYLWDFANDAGAHYTPFMQ